MALLTYIHQLQHTGFEHHSLADPLITNDVLYQLSYCGNPAAIAGLFPKCNALFSSTEKAPALLLLPIR